MKIKLHKHLDTKIWNKNDTIRKDVSDMLLSIAWAFIDYVRNEYDMDIRNNDIHDIIVFGSITQLFYDKKSDIDMTIVLNLERLEKQFPGLDITKWFKLYYYDWAMIHICKIYGHKIDLSIQDTREPVIKDRYRPGANYSLIHQKWVFKPRALSHKEIKETELLANKVYKQIFHDYKIVKKNGFKLEECEKLYQNILASKNSEIMMLPDKSITPTYMAFRQFKHNGYIKKLRTKAVKKETAKYVLK